MMTSNQSWRPVSLQYKTSINRRLVRTWAEVSRRRLSGCACCHALGGRWLMERRQMEGGKCLPTQTKRGIHVIGNHDATEVVVTCLLLRTFSHENCGDPVKSCIRHVTVMKHVYVSAWSTRLLRAREEHGPEWTAS